MADSNIKLTPDALDLLKKEVQNLNMEVNASIVNEMTDHQAAIHCLQADVAGQQQSQDVLAYQLTILYDKLQEWFPDKPEIVVPNITDSMREAYKQGYDKKLQGD